MTRTADLRSRFRELHHRDEILIMPNPFDVGSAKVLAAAGARALATTSSGHAATMGRLDQNVTLDEVLAHAESMAAATELPLNIDSEDCFADTTDGVAASARLFARTDAAGFSIEDYDPRAERIRDIDDAAARVAAAKEGGEDLLLTARAENHLYGVADLDDTISRLIAYRDAGADVLYAPGVTTANDVSRLIEAIDAPINVLALPGTPSIPQLADLGVSRVSVGGLAAWAAYGAVVEMAQELFGPGTSTYTAGVLSGSVRDAAFR